MPYTRSDFDGALLNFRLFLISGPYSRLGAQGKLPSLPIEIINNTRGGIEGEIWERGDWGANSSPVCSLIHDVRRVFLLFKLFFAVKILQISFLII